MDILVKTVLLLMISSVLLSVCIFAIYIIKEEILDFVSRIEFAKKISHLPKLNKPFTEEFERRKSFYARCVHFEPIKNKPPD